MLRALSIQGVITEQRSEVLARLRVHDIPEQVNMVLDIRAYWRELAILLTTYLPYTRPFLCLSDDKLLS